MITTVCFLLHFDQPIGNPADPLGQAQHYLGSSTSLDAELARFRKNGGHAKIMQELHRQGIGFELVRTWPGGRVQEGRLKGKSGQRTRGQGLRRLCPVCGCAGSWYQKGETMIGGYSAIAVVLSTRFEASVDRRQVSAWYKRGTRNQDGQQPPTATQVLDQPPRTTPRYLFDTDDWVAWFRPGVPGPRGKGWKVYRELDDTRQPIVVPRRTGRPSTASLLAAGNNQ